MEADSNLHEAQAVFECMEAQQNFTMNYTYILMSSGAWAYHCIKHDMTGRSAEKAEALLRRTLAAGSPSMNKVYTIAVDGWSKGAGICQNAVKRAEMLLSE